MASLTELETAKNRALMKCQASKEKMKVAAVDSPTAFTRYAQEANDSWLEFKKLEKELQNLTVMKQMGDLYGVV